MNPDGPVPNPGDLMTADEIAGLIAGGLAAYVSPDDALRIAIRGIDAYLRHRGAIEWGVNEHGEALYSVHISRALSWEDAV